jgi:hypothetical protein
MSMSSSALPRSSAQHCADRRTIAFTAGDNRERRGDGVADILRALKHSKPVLEPIAA